MVPFLSIPCFWEFRVGHSPSKNVAIQINGNVRRAKILLTEPVHSMSEDGNVPNVWYALFPEHWVSGDVPFLLPLFLIRLLLNNGCNL